MFFFGFHLKLFVQVSSLMSCAGFQSNVVG